MIPRPAWSDPPLTSVVAIQSALGRALLVARVAGQSRPGKRLVALVADNDTFWLGNHDPLRVLIEVSARDTPQTRLIWRGVLIEAGHTESTVSSGVS